MREREREQRRDKDIGRTGRRTSVGQEKTYRQIASQTDTEGDRQTDRQTSKQRQK